MTAIRTLQYQYASRHQGRFAPSFDELIKTVKLLEEFSGESPIVNGYIFTMTANEPTVDKPAVFSIKANPQIAEGFNATGKCSFYYDSTLKAIKYSEEGEADAQSPSI